MSLPIVRVNTFLRENEKQHIDLISKIYIVIGVMFGLDRLSLIGNGKIIYVFLTFILCVILNVLVIYISVEIRYVFSVSMCATIIRNLLTSFLSFTRRKWLERYYNELNKFDTVSGCRPKVPKGCIWNALQAGLTSIFIVVLHIFVHVFRIFDYNRLYLSLFHVIYILEVSYFGHLVNLLTPRIKLINYHLKLSLTSTSLESSHYKKEFVNFKPYDAKIDQCQMRKLMDLYKVAVKAHDFLIEGIKWQLLANITCVFMMVSGYLFKYSINVIRTGVIVTDGSLLVLGISVTIMIPLFAPCIFSDSLYNEVTKLRELLASQLYENKQDKSARSIARSLLAFSEKRDMSFQLLRMLNIDSSLPFKFGGWLVTYLIILLQFHKVMNH